MKFFLAEVLFQRDMKLQLFTPMTVFILFAGLNTCVLWW